MKLTRGQDPANRSSAEGAEREPVGNSSGSAWRDLHGLRAGLEGLRDLMDRLLGPDGCPWDRAQTLDTLRPFLVEETYEVLDAMGDAPAHRDELGDLLFQIVFQSALREREGAFDLDDVVTCIREKLVRRHPHVFGDAPGEAPSEVRTPEDVERQWAEIKARERGGKQPHDDPFARIPRGLPALSRAAKLQQAAARLGFDWPDIDGAIAKMFEEWRELSSAREAGDPAEIRDELGDLLFVLVRIAQKLGVAPDDALARANVKFERRFGEVLRRCRDAGMDPATAGLAELDALWTAVKTAEPATAPPVATTTADAPAATTKPGA